MRPDESFVGQPIRSLQTMLRYIAESDPSHRSVVPDGIYGTQTAEAVSRFQQIHGLPVTGVTDQATWDAIHGVYEPSRVNVDAAEPLQIILNPNQVIRKGERHPNIHIAQAILYVLSEIYESISEPSKSGVLDDLTADSIASFQILSNLPMTGDLDKLTWKHLALQYPLAANLLTLSDPFNDRQENRNLLIKY